MTRAGVALLLFVACRHAPSPAATAPLSDEAFGYFVDETRVELLLDELSRVHHPATLAFEHVSVISLAHPGIDSDQTVIVRDGQITAVGAAAAAAVPPDALVIDGRGRFLMPGLADMHVHTELSTSNYLLDLANGVTSVREMNGSPWLLAMRARARANDALIPNLYVAGPILASAPLGNDAIVVTTPEAARAEVRAQHAAGYELVKVHNVVAPAIYDAICDEARRVGVDVVGHIPHDTTIARALACPQRTFEHFKSYIDDHTLTLTGEDYVAVTRGADVWNTPTFYTYRSHLRGDAARRLVREAPEMRYVAARERAAWLKLADEPAKPVQLGEFSLEQRIFRALLPIGARFLAGTDTGGGYPYSVRGFGLHEELRIMADQGMPLAAVLATATVEPARAMRRTDVGTVAPRQRADLILLRANPLESIANLDAIDGVAVRGTWLDRAALDAMLARLAEIDASHAPLTRAALEEALAALEQLRAGHVPLRPRFLGELRYQLERARFSTQGRLFTDIVSRPPE
jgi:imidazolonepropionase-like amidohydrolase